MSLGNDRGRQRISFRPASSKILSDNKGRAVFERTMTSSDLELKTVTIIEFDGMVRIDMTPHPEKENHTRPFSYAFHLPRKNALFTHFIGAPNSNISIMIPKESFSMTVPGTDGEFFSDLSNRWSGSATMTAFSGSAVRNGTGRLRISRSDLPP